MKLSPSLFILMSFTIVFLQINQISTLTNKLLDVKHDKNGSKNNKTL